MGYRLRVNYRGHWKLSRVVYPTLEAAKESQSKLTSMNVQSKLCDATGKEVKE